MAEERHTLCNRDCPDACGIVATVDQGRVVRLRGDRDHPVTRGFLCYRTSLFLETQYAAERLTQPLLRKQGELRPVEWDEALDFVAERLLRIRAESGPAAILHYRSGGSLGLLKGISDLFFAHFGPTAVKSGDICSGAGDEAQLLDFGVEDSNHLLDLLNARNIILWGKNPFVSSPHTFQVLREARARGAELILIDPVHHRSASICHAYHPIRPGGDFALAMAVARVLFERGCVDPQAQAYCDHLEEFSALCRQRLVEDWCREADLSPTVAVDLAQRLGPGKPTAILVGWGLGRRTNGGATIRALDALGAVSGNLGISGGGVSFYFARRSAFDTTVLSGPRPPPRTVSEISLARDLAAAREPPYRAVWVTCGNPVAMLPESRRTDEVLRGLELVVVVDSFLTDTARCATVVFPTTTLLEADDLVGSYGHHYVGVATPVVAQPPQVRSDLEIIQALAARVGLSSVVAGSARDWKERLVRPKLASGGVSVATLEQGVLKNPLAPDVLFADRRFKTRSGKVNLITEAPASPAAATADFPLSLMALSTDQAQSSQWSRRPSGPATATVHPKSSPVGHGELALLRSREGSLVVKVLHDDRQRRDVVLVPKGGHLSTGHCANALVRSRLTDLGEGAALYEEGVRLEPYSGDQKPLP